MNVVQGVLLALAGVFAFTGNGAWRHRLNAPASLAPGRVTDLRVTAVTDSAAVLTWTEVTTSGSGVARYVVRFGPLTATPFAWGSHADVTTGGCAAPVYGSTAGGGRTRSCVLTGLARRTGYDVQLMAYTGVLNATAVFGPVSNLARFATAERVGPMLVVRPPMLLDSLRIFEASLPYDFGPRRFPLHGTFPAGDRVATFYDSTGALVAFGYLLLVKPAP